MISSSFFTIFVILLCFTVLANQTLPTAYALMSVENVRIVDAFGNVLSDVEVEQQFQISGDVYNSSTKSKQYYFVVEIVDDSDELVFGPEWISAVIGPEQALSNAIAWIPKQDGEYTAIVSLYDAYPFDKEGHTLSSTTKIMVGHTINKEPKPVEVKLTCSQDQQLIDGKCQDNPSTPIEAIIIIGVIIIGVPTGIFALKSFGTKSSHVKTKQHYDNKSEDELHNELFYWIEIEYGLIEEEKTKRSNGK